MYRLQVLTLQNQTLVFSIKSYSIEDGGFIRFFDEKYKVYKMFHASRCEINEVPDTDQKVMPDFQELGK